MIKFSKRILALIMSMLMIFSCMAVSASAEGEGTEPDTGATETTPVTIQIPAPVCKFDMATMTINVAKPDNIAYPAEGENKVFYPVELTAVAGEKAVTLAPNADGSFDICDVEFGTEYTVTAKLVDNEDDNVTVEGTASTKITPAITLPSIKDNCEFDAEKRTITVKEPSNVVIDGAEYIVGVMIQPEADSKILGNGDTVFSNLEYGKKYTVKGYVYLSAESDAIYTTENFEVTIDKQQSKPATPVPTAITSKSITIKAEKGVKYIISDGENTPVYLEDGKTAIEFKDLKPFTQYTITAQRPAMEGFYASEIVSISVKTKKAASTDVPKLSLVDKSNTSITVEADIPNVEYKVNNGAWQASGVFKNLSADTQYTFYARVKFNATEQEESTVSAPLIVKTNATANYVADENKIAFSCKDGQYANTKISFTVTGDGPANMNNVVFGDTRIIPVSFVVKFGEDVIGEGTFTDKKLSQTGSFTPAEAYAEKSVNVIVTFRQEKFKGTDADGNANWVAYGEKVEDITFDKTFSVKLGRVDGAMTKITEFFEMIANFLFNTVPAFLAEAMKSDIWGRMLKILGQLGGALGG